MLQLCKTSKARPMSTNLLTPASITLASSAYLERLAQELDVPPSRYEEARRRFKSVGGWLCREESTLKDLEPDVYVQGSFKLGIPIRPVNEDEHYDVDLVCELKAATKAMSQQRLKDWLGHEMKLYAKAHGMRQVGESRRCWTLDYADGAQFHLDALPAIPDAEGQRRVLASRGLTNTWSDTAIAITDNEHPRYREVSDAWPHSNPRGYTEWVRSRMRTVVEARRNAMALEARASVEDIPSYRVKTPLQQGIQVLKRHRDLMFADDPTDKPISVILTTLSALAYQSEPTVAQALQGILARMDSFIQYDAQGFPVILNPTDPAENFADRWRQYPKRREAFFTWLQRARADLKELTSQWEPKVLMEAAERFSGRRTAVLASVPATQGKRTLLSLVPRAAALLSAPHRQAPTWPAVRMGHVRIGKATWQSNGFSRPMRFYSDSQPLRKNLDLKFEAHTDVPAPYDVYWQVVNSGLEATQARSLRGGFNKGTVGVGSLVYRDATAYTGTHTLECFIVKNGLLVARSGVFVVNIA